jgi:probable F420-dependent oxidoreductase
LSDTLHFCASFQFGNPDHFLELAQVAEESGWSEILLSDHIVHHEHIDSSYPYLEHGERMWKPETAWPDVWVATGMMAAVTKTLRFSQFVYVLPMRDPFSVAKAAGTAARLSNNRISMGIGLGWLREEFDLLGTPWPRRGRRADEMIEVMRKLWTGEFVEYHGEFFDFDRLIMSPGLEAPIPIIIGGNSPLSLRRAARLGDGWAPAYLTLPEIREGIETIERKRAEYGRAATPFSVYTGTAETSGLDGLQRLRDAGVTHVPAQPLAFFEGAKSIGIEHMLNPPLDAMRDALRRYGDEVIAKLGA